MPFHRHAMVFRCFSEGKHTKPVTKWFVERGLLNMKCPAIFRGSGAHHSGPYCTKWKVAILDICQIATLLLLSFCKSHWEGRMFKWMVSKGVTASIFLPKHSVQVVLHAAECCRYRLEFIANSVISECVLLVQTVGYPSIYEQFLQVALLSCPHISSLSHPLRI